MRPTCPSSCRVNGTALDLLRRGWRCLIDHKATSVFQRHRTHLASFVSAALTQPFLFASFCSRLHCGEGTFLRVELCQRSSYSLRPAGVRMAFQCHPCQRRLTDRGFHRASGVGPALRRAARGRCGGGERCEGRWWTPPADGGTGTLLRRRPNNKRATKPTSARTRRSENRVHRGDRAKDAV